MAYMDPFARHTGLSRQTLKRFGRTIVQTQNDLRRSLKYPRGDINRDEFRARKEFLRRAFWGLRFNGIEGDYAEFGCNAALTFRLAFNAGRLTGRPRHQWAFDSFQGLPDHTDRDAHPEWVPGSMATGVHEFRSMCRKSGLREGADYTIVAGFYSESLARTSVALPEAIALAYIDCDLYSSTVDVLRFLMPRLRHGMILALDDYYCYTGEEVAGNRLAVAESFREQREWRLVPYMQYGWNGMSFLVEQVSLLASPVPW